MKKTIIVLTVLFASFTLTAQEFRIGINAGMDAARLSISGGSGGPIKTKSGLTAGITGEARISNVFAVQLEANYSSQGTGIVTVDGEESGSFQLEYLTIPVLAKLYGTPRLSVYAGPQLGILLKAKSLASNSDDADIKELLKSTDFYSVFGAEYRFANGIFISGRYHFGLNNLIDSENDQSDLKNRYYSMRIGYSIKL
jgi:hypothetical protein